MAHNPQMPIHGHVRTETSSLEIWLYEVALKLVDFTHNYVVW